MAKGRKLESSYLGRADCQYNLLLRQITLWGPIGHVQQSWPAHDKGIIHHSDDQMTCLWICQAGTQFDVNANLNYICKFWVKLWSRYLSEPYADMKRLCIVPGKCQEQKNAYQNLSWFLSSSHNFSAISFAKPYSVPKRTVMTTCTWTAFKYEANPQSAESKN